MSEDIDLDAELGALALPDGELVGDLIKAGKFLAGFSPDMKAAVHALSAVDMLRQPRKRHRIAHCLIGLYDRLQKLEKKIDREYVRQEKFADHAHDAFRRASDDPDEARRKNFEVILANIAVKRDPRPTFEEERMVIRLADELTTAHLRVVIAHDGRRDQGRDRDEHSLARDAILKRRADVQDIKGVIDDLCAFRVMERDKVNTSPSVKWLGDSLTPVGLRLLEYLRE
jgi:hypothetical protein